MNLEQFRRSACTLMVTLAVTIAAARVCNVELTFEPSMYRAPGNVSPTAPTRKWPESRPAAMPTFSSNDRSRWSAARALVDDGTWAVGHRFSFGDGRYLDQGIIFEDGWGSVDKVLKPEVVADFGWLQVREFHSSKPPLLTFAMACEYWLLKRSLGWTLTGHTNLVVKTTLLTFNVLPLALYLLLLVRLVDRFGATDWGKLFVVAAACFGTFVTTFSTTLNNHTLAAVTTLLAVMPWLCAVDGKKLSTRHYIQSGFFAGLTFCLELPAAAFAGLLFLALLRRDWRRTLLAGLPAALLPLVLQFALNYMAIGELSPVYAKFGGPWYQYPGSHWLPPAADQVKYGIDWARMHESIFTYWFHVLIGHHGLFSLSPIWLMSFAAMARSLWRRDALHARLAALVLPSSLLVIGFYLFWSDNYGGWTSGLRWLMWLSPLWLLTMLPLADRLAVSKWGRRSALALLAISVFSASYPALNPWRHPWLYHFLDARGWIPYGG